MMIHFVIHFVMIYLNICLNNLKIMVLNVSTFIVRKKYGTINTTLFTFKCINWMVKNLLTNKIPNLQSLNNLILATIIPVCFLLTMDKPKMVSKQNLKSLKYCGLIYFCRYIHIFRGLRKNSIFLWIFDLVV